MSNYSYTVNGYDISEPLPLAKIAEMFSYGELPATTLVNEAGKKAWLPIEGILKEANLYEAPTTVASKKASAASHSLQEEDEVEDAASVEEAAPSPRPPPPPASVARVAQPEEVKDDVVEEEQKPVKELAKKAPAAPPAPLDPPVAKNGAETQKPVFFPRRSPASVLAAAARAPVAPAMPAVFVPPPVVDEPLAELSEVVEEQPPPAPFKGGKAQGDIFTVAERFESEKTTVEILEYEQLAGSNDVNIAEALYFVHQSGMRLKQVRVLLEGGAVVVESGTLHFWKGNLTVTSGVGGVGGLAKKLTTGMLTREHVIRPLYEGSGELFLEPSFGHFLIIHLDDDTVITEKGMFYAAESSVQVSAVAQKHISAGVFGGEGWFQTSLRGKGWAVLSSPVPVKEVIRCSLNNEKLAVEGNLVLLRKGNVDFRVEKSAKTIFGTVVGGQGLVQTFTGTGEVWIAPTKSVYEHLKQKDVGLAAMEAQLDDLQKES
ncbi:MAG: AIM24 family protein [bacterium]